MEDQVAGLAQVATFGTNRFTLFVAAASNSIAPLAKQSLGGVEQLTASFANFGDCYRFEGRHAPQVFWSEHRLLAKVAQVNQGSWNDASD